MQTPLQVSQWLKHACNTLTNLDSPKLDADLMMCHALKCNRATLYAWPEKILSNNQLDTLNTLLERRVAGEPIAYILGIREFWSLEFDVNKDVLVPRPETELLVELVLSALESGIKQPLLDAGTGSGAIAIAVYLQWLSDHGEHLVVTASDYSEAALALAKRNAAKLNANKISFIHSNWLSAFADNSMGIIVSNPPYLAEDDPHMHNNTLHFEPKSALVSGKDGLEDIRTIVEQACRVGVSECYVLIEHGFEQAAEVQQIMSAAHYSGIQTHKDINEHNRVTAGYCPRK